MESQSKSFTLQASGLLRVLKTDCGVCRAFDPLTSGKHPSIQRVVGLWDTGATGTVISEGCAEKLVLNPVGNQRVYHADGNSIINSYVINHLLPNQVAFQFVKVTEGKLNGTDLLIGVDIISMGDFSIANFAGKTTFSFRVPSTTKIDFVEESKNNKQAPKWLQRKDKKDYPKKR